MTHPVEIREQFIERRARGQTLKKIAEDLNLSYNTSCQWNKDYREQISAAKALYLEELEERFYLTTESRLQLFGDQLELIKSEIAKRDLSDMPTHKLFEILIALHKEIRGEAVMPEFLTEQEVEERKTSRLARSAKMEALNAEIEKLVLSR